MFLLQTLVLIYLFYTQDLLVYHKLREMILDKIFKKKVPCRLLSDSHLK